MAVERPDDALAWFDDVLPVLDISSLDYAPGAPSEASARLAFEALEVGSGLVRSGGASGLITGPVAKSWLQTIGFHYPGQTEYVAERCGVSPNNAVMMLAGPQLRTVPVTVHSALSAVPGLLTSELIRSRAAICATALARDFGIAAPRLAVAGLNPHAGEGGQFGDEEARIIEPAIAALREQGIAVTGPHAPDALFQPRARATYDVAICMYHDQALIPLKALDFDSGVNVTLGLPVVRTSPDHGTAFGIAGRRLADPGAMIAAIRMAGEIAARRAAG